MMDGAEFDYVIVGAGSSGCALAGRLSERASCSVALIEAGHWDRDPWLHIPVGYYRMAFSSKFTWGYVTEPDPGLGGRAIPWPRGKVVGGSSSINGLVYIRGQREDFRRWRRLGAVGWDWEDMLPLFLRMEGRKSEEDTLNGQGGPLGVVDIREHDPIMSAYGEAAQQAGISWTDDFNGELQEGVGHYRLTIRGRFRCSAARAYLRPALRRPNLKVLTRTRARRVLLDGKRATGVEVDAPNGRLRLRARGEVILCGGAINSPQLLELSGIGNPKVLKAAGIEPVVNRRDIGENLQDHLQVKTVFHCRERSTINDTMRNPLKLAGVGLKYVLRGRGLMTVGAAQIGIFTRVLPESQSPDVQFHVMPGSTTNPSEGMDRFPAFTATVCQLRPESRGHLHIDSPDPERHPRIVANYLATETDRRTVVEGLRLSRRIAAQPALSRYYGGEKYPGAEAQSDGDLLAWAEKVGTTIYHPSGTCRMGSDDDAVVDPSLRVRGIDRLRVADASVMPTLISGNTNATCMAIGERLADVLMAAERS